METALGKVRLGQNWFCARLSTFHLLYGRFIRIFLPSSRIFEPLWPSPSVVTLLPLLWGKVGVSSQLAARFSDIVPHRTYETNGLFSSSDKLLQCIITVELCMATRVTLFPALFYLCSTATAHFPANGSCSSFTAIGPLTSKKPWKSLLVVTCHLRTAFTIKQIKARPVYKQVNNLLCNKGDWAAWAASSCCSTNSMNIILKKREMNYVNKLRVSCKHNLGEMLVLVGANSLLLRTAE